MYIALVDYLLYFSYSHVAIYIVTCLAYCAICSGSHRCNCLLQPFVCSKRGIRRGCSCQPLEWAGVGWTGRIQDADSACNGYLWAVTHTHTHGWLFLQSGL